MLVSFIQLDSFFIDFIQSTFLFKKSKSKKKKNKLSKIALQENGPYFKNTNFLKLQLYLKSLKGNAIDFAGILKRSLK